MEHIAFRRRAKPINNVYLNIAKQRLRVNARASRGSFYVHDVRRKPAPATPRTRPAYHHPNPVIAFVGEMKPAAIVIGMIGLAVIAALAVSALV